MTRPGDPTPVERAVYSVPGMSCEHCREAIAEQLSGLPGVRDATVDLETKLVSIDGAGLEDSSIRAAIARAGYEAEVRS